jgi:hypothetical protein
VRSAYIHGPVRARHAFLVKESMSRSVLSNVEIETIESSLPRKREREQNR